MGRERAPPKQPSGASHLWLGLVKVTPERPLVRRTQQSHFRAHSIEQTCWNAAFLALARAYKSQLSVTGARIPALIRQNGSAARLSLAAQLEQFNFAEGEMGNYHYSISVLTVARKAC